MYLYMHTGPSVAKKNTALIKTNDMYEKNLHTAPSWPQ